MAWKHKKHPLHSIHCGFVVGRRLITMLSFWPEKTLRIDKEENKSRLLHIVHCSYICPAHAERLPKSACDWKGGGNVYTPTSRQKEKEFDEEEYVILTQDLAIQQHVQRMDEFYCYLIGRRISSKYQLLTNRKQCPHRCKYFLWEFMWCWQLWSFLTTQRSVCTLQSDNRQEKHLT